MTLSAAFAEAFATFTASRHIVLFCESLFLSAAFELLAFFELVLVFKIVDDCGTMGIASHVVFHGVLLATQVRNEEDMTKKVAGQKKEKKKHNTKEDNGSYKTNCT